MNEAIDAVNNMLPCFRSSIDGNAARVRLNAATK